MSFPCFSFRPSDDSKNDPKTSYELPDTHWNDFKDIWDIFKISHFLKFSSCFSSCTTNFKMHVKSFHGFENSKMMKTTQMNFLQKQKLEFYLNFNKNSMISDKNRHHFENLHEMSKITPSVNQEPNNGGECFAPCLKHETH